MSAGRINATVVLADPDETVTVVVDGRDHRGFEVQGRGDCGVPLMAPLEDVMRAVPQTWMAWLCWHALVIRGGGQFGKWREFNGRVLTVTPEQDDDAEEADADPLDRPIGVAS